MNVTLTPFLRLTNTDPFAAWFVVTGDATPDGIRVVTMRMIDGRSFSLPPQCGFERVAKDLARHHPLLLNPIRRNPRPSFPISPKP